ncbi:hypothetical protein ANN_18105 [Periplaneta americana]|uniref:Uncharacterized protein n=1 Tax=Periplaneta americana TaxID=6978 RepID=A0ABQ8SMU7_PERAM|nr:hypothetical protein ANN_18105 [Periplaneta americana]
MNPGSNTESYPAFAHIGLRENPGKNSTRMDLWMEIYYSFVINLDDTDTDELSGGVESEFEEEENAATDNSWSFEGVSTIINEGRERCHSWWDCRDFFTNHRLQFVQCMWLLTPSSGPKERPRRARDLTVTSDNLSAIACLRADRWGGRTFAGVRALRGCPGSKAVKSITRGVRPAPWIVSRHSSVGKSAQRAELGGPGFDSRCGETWTPTLKKEQRLRGPEQPRTTDPLERTALKRQKFQLASRAEYRTLHNMLQAQLYGLQLSNNKTSGRG